MSNSGYTILGFLVWKGGKLYLRRRYGDKPRKIAVAGLLVLGLGAAFAAQRRAAA